MCLTDTTILLLSRCTISSMIELELNAMGTKTAVIPFSFSSQVSKSNQH